VILVDPSELDDVISVIPAMRLSCRSRGVATDDAMISALAPGKDALMLIVGKSTCGRGDAGSTVYAIAPAMPMAMVSRIVATGLRMNGSEMLMLTFRFLQPVEILARFSLGNALRDAVEEDVNNRGRVKRQNLADEQSTNHRDA